ncbi:MAG: dTDP-4-dehydrorhamnose 3,5-epimerase, partial [Candidatus Hydrothermota bacterium]
MIQGVAVKKLRVIPDERGFLMEILRDDDEIFEKFGQVYITTVYPGV